MAGSLGENTARCRLESSQGTAYGPGDHSEECEGCGVAEMPRAAWSDLLARASEPHLLAVVLPDATEEQSLSNGQSAQRLMMRLLNKLRLQGDYAEKHRSPRTTPYQRWHS